MSYKRILSIVGIVATSATMYGMNCALKLSQKPLRKRSFFYSAQDLRNKIEKPHFEYEDVNVLIAALPVDEKNNCKKNGLIEYIVYKATEYNEYESKYATVLKQLRNHGWQKSPCCVDVMLHSAVISNLPDVVDELLEHDNEWVHARDLHECIPLHYAQSSGIAKSLLTKGSRVTTKDRDGNIPLHTVGSSVVPVMLDLIKDINAQHTLLHAENDLSLRIPNYGWQKMTPLRKAVDEGDLEKVCALMHANIDGFVVNEKELDILLSLANLCLWRTNDPMFWGIKSKLSNYKKYHYE